MENKREYLLLIQHNIKYYLYFILGYIAFVFLLNLILSDYFQISYFPGLFLTFIILYPFEFGFIDIPKWNGKIPEGETVKANYVVLSLSLPRLQYDLILTDKSIILKNRYNFKKNNYIIEIDRVKAIQNKYKKSLIFNLKYYNDIMLSSNERVKLREKILEIKNEKTIEFKDS
jgi:hypothetical protein